jgi:hypothetical protein
MDDDSVFAEIYGSISSVRQESAPEPHPALVKSQSAFEEVLQSCPPTLPPPRPAFSRSCMHAQSTVNCCRSLPTLEELRAQDDFNIHLDEPDASGTDAVPASQPGRPPFQVPTRPDAGMQRQLPVRPYVVTGWQPSMPPPVALPVTRPVRPLYVPAGAKCMHQ